MSVNSPLVLTQRANTSFQISFTASAAATPTVSLQVVSSYSPSSLNLTQNVNTLQYNATGVLEPTGGILQFEIQASVYGVVTIRPVTIIVFGECHLNHNTSFKILAKLNQ